MVIILGDGVAARIMCHMLQEKSIKHQVLCVPPRGVNNISGGVRFLEVPSVDQPNYRDRLGSYSEKIMEGGVIVDSYFKKWEEIFDNEAYKHYLTGRYAIEQNRAWTTGIMNKLFTRKTPPSYVSDISYQEFLDRFQQISNPLLVDSFDRIDLIGRSIHYTKNDLLKPTDPYDILINTLPINVFNKLAGNEILNLRLTHNFELVQQINSTKDMMWYTLGYGPLKRVSVIQGMLKLEVGKHSDDIKNEYYKIMLSENHLLDTLSKTTGILISMLFDRWTYNALPPNFSVCDAENRDLMMKNMPTNVYHIGRFAEALPKVMMGDIVERATLLVNQINE